ncbi:UDP-N-acetylmuramoylalanyl-D-glutamyl-2,6-diaminopimelate--D-alanyl-D-alanine ligase [Pikeienuella piscinae]|uniref:UDP-N-acetylmuramoyl-tripeptide--D-alanyl-D-alanine ligase n=1 Tax=Pikeienuella piscinae TaxID=2748098 RepID=A0A7M3T6L8_9RHOB|nr:UDP-N-acetylmuramoylalanyl-D-glutamyl-2,6-diaminopimelate--D-alanyl-D-alanine ligase [Pikeienuella piscinae]QIE57649.1 UDP-N-acetylmuramoylalanyl-D-glutamyl-2,6-diaminopimelate--D-alanyl-D-alanine ligase [Pikeienuella piscinae]
MTGALWTEEEAAAATGGRATAGFNVSGVSIDSRSLNRGDLFVALQDARDGHEFVAAAFKAGAAAAMVGRVPGSAPPGAPLLVVKDPLAGLWGLAAASRSRTQAKVIAVTGSVGKTGVKEMLRACLGASGPTHAAEKSFNNHWGAPLTLARMPEATRFAAIEIGMNQPGEIAPLSRLARPDVTIVTTVEAVHLAGFDSVEAIADEKAEIFDGLVAGGVAILNADNVHFERLAAAARHRGARVVAFGSGARADARLESARLTGRATVVKATLHGRPLMFKIGAPGRHLALNALAALAATDAVDGDVAKAALALGRWTPPEGRGSRWRIEIGEGGNGGSITLIDESYNANPVSMRAALAVLCAAKPEDHVGRIDKGRRVAFLGDMLELGSEAEAMHAALAAAEEMAGVDLVHCCGPLTRALHDALPAEKRGEWFGTSADLAAAVGRKLDAGDVAMVKGSLGSKMAPVVAAIRRMGHVRPDAEGG